jgi:hypothetical protein
VEAVDRAEAESEVVCKHLDSKALCAGMLCLYAVIHRTMKDSLLENKDGEKPRTQEEFRKQRRHKRVPSDPNINPL